MRSITEVRLIHYTPETRPTHTLVANYYILPLCLEVAQLDDVPAQAGGVSVYYAYAFRYIIESERRWAEPSLETRPSLRSTGCNYDHHHLPRVAWYPGS